LDIFGTNIWSGIYNKKWNLRLAVAQAICDYSQNFSKEKYKNKKEKLLEGFFDIILTILKDKVS